MQFPKTLKIILIDTDTNVPVGDICVSLKFFAKEKNDYTVLPECSGKNGEINIDKNWIDAEFKKERALFPRDYASKLFGCKDQIEIFIMDDAAIEKAMAVITSRHDYYENAAELIDRLSAAQNRLYRNKKFMIRATEIMKKELVLKISKSR